MKTLKCWVVVKKGTESPLALVDSYGFYKTKEEAYRDPFLDDTEEVIKAKVTIERIGNERRTEAARNTIGKHGQ